MTLTIQTLPVPLRVGERGDVRVGNSRVLLDLIIAEYRKGATPEDIVRGYDTLQLADVYATIAYYLTYREEVEAYLRRREEEATALRQKLEAEGISRPGFWEELKARAAVKQESGNAPASHG
jgi:uncharacterized protein (DUF433 family)